jgi:hypothetical protein
MVFAYAMNSGRGLIVQQWHVPTNVLDMERVTWKRKHVLARLVGKDMTAATNFAPMIAVAKGVVLLVAVNVHLGMVGLIVLSLFASKSVCNMANVSRELANATMDGQVCIVKKNRVQRTATTEVYAMMANVSV